MNLPPLPAPDVPPGYDTGYDEAGMYGTYSTARLREYGQQCADVAIAAEREAIWVLFDLSNSNPRSKNYLWWFETRALAIEHKRHQEAMQHGAVLSEPQKWCRPMEGK